ncbi:hypothetical protein SOCE26_042660 [Sorangium cellulosum]|uniref:Secreted protein n=1 Tax=Sorangium cellulosum TaxID=56 RepID=A0A2L0EU57_SORCE|nr:DUF4360 domain-containing protein [Sorangium cellulosum]AUX42831.1 hypothetical protein SOCE26_042660 [Sorangium cellulosum]
MLLRSAFVVSSAFSVFLCAFPALAQNARIEGFTYAGSGCPVGTAAGFIAADQKALTMIFDQFEAQAGPGAPRAANRAFCQLAVDLRFDPGWQVALFDATYRGFADLEPGVLASHETSYYFSGSPLTSGPLTWSMAGPFTRDFSRTDSFAATVWSECGTVRPLNIKTSLYVTNRLAPSRSGVVTNDTTDVQVRIEYVLAYRRCAGP